MNKVLCLCTTSILSFSLMGCTTTSKETNSSEQPSSNVQSKIPIVDTKTQSNDIKSPIENAAQKNRFNQFIANSQKGVRDNIRITYYTVEGDPIINEFSFNGQNFEVTTDTTRDKFGQGTINKFTCSKIGQEEKESIVYYELTGCPDSFSVPVALVY